jgi:hypothetical protein
VCFGATSAIAGEIPVSRTTKVQLNGVRIVGRFRRETSGFDGPVESLDRKSLMATAN